MYFTKMGRAEMEALATEMTREKNNKRRMTNAKLEKIRQFNREHPITSVETVVVYQSEPTADEIARESAR